MSTPGELILLIERAGRPERTFCKALKEKGFALEIVPSGQQALQQIKTTPPALIILNSLFLGSNGLRLCRHLQEAAPDTPVIHIVDGNMLDDPRNGLAEVTLMMPFTARKLINSIRRLLPPDRHDALEVGPIRLLPRAQIVRAYGREKRLTARTTELLHLFLKHPKETLDRGYVMREVWQTDYIGDTRTLDVHIRWMREAIEPETRQPRHIITVRGKGYRFEP